MRGAPDPPRTAPRAQVSLGEDDVQQVLESLCYEGELDNVRRGTRGGGGGGGGLGYTGGDAVCVAAVCLL